ncbi:hypothetical protein FC682_11740 [Peribacillus simplex]|uniref:hypothetical protein n=1 Tax=Peribacillus simplex TaxID=1478 RepID=UPI0010BEC3C3|nr:hypothetical protein [Peribacillus simplex]TKH04808.1 hypothetical protein FC682_11740 [Peribacillus simplex]
MPNLREDNVQPTNPVVYTVESEGILEAKRLDELLEKFLNRMNLMPPTEVERVPNVEVQEIKITSPSPTGENQPGVMSSTNDDLEVEAKTTDVTLFLGNNQHKLSTDVTLKVVTLADSLQKTWEALIKGKLTIGSANFQIEYDLNRNDRLYGMWKETPGETLSFMDLPKGLGIPYELPIDSLNLDLSLKQVAFELNLDKGLFSLSTQSSHYDEAFFLATNANDKWDFSFGLMMQPSKLPGTVGQVASELLRMAKVDQVCFLISTIEDNLFVLPTLPELPIDLPYQPFQLLKQHPIRIESGIGLFLATNLSESDFPLVQLLKSVIGQDRLILQTPLLTDATGQKFQAYLNKPLVLHVGGEKLILNEPSIVVHIDPFLLAIKGHLLISLGSESLDCIGSIVLTETKAECSFEVVKTDGNGQPRPLPNLLLGFQGIELDSISINMGWVYQPPSLFVGLGGSFHVKEQPPETNQFKIVLSLKGTVPDPLLFYSYFEQVDLETVYLAVTGQALSGVPNFFKGIKGRKLKLYWSQITDVMADGTVIRPGFGFNGIIDVFGLTAYASLEIQKGAGIRGTAQIEPIKIKNMLYIGGRGEGVKIKEYKVDGSWIALQEKPEGNLESRDVTVIQPGGALFKFNTNMSPYLLASMRITFLDLIDQLTEVEITDKGIIFTLDYQISNTVHMELHCELKDKNSFNGVGEFSLDLDMEIGPIKILGTNLGSFSLNTEFNARFEVGVSPSEVKFLLTGYFKFEDMQMEIPPIELSGNFKTMRDLPNLIINQIKENAQTIFKDLFDLGESLLENAKEAIEEGIRATEAAVKKTLNHAEEEAKRTIESSKQLLQSIGTSIEDANQQAASLIAEANELPNKSKEEAEKIVQQASEKVKELENHTKEILNNIDEEINELNENIKREVEQFVKNAEAAAQHASEQVVKIGEEAQKQVEEWGVKTQELINGINQQADEAVVKLGEETQKALESARKRLQEWGDKAANYGNKVGTKISKVFG